MAFFSVAVTLNVAAKTPEAIYQSHCAACHNMGVAGAPKRGDGEAWKPRLALGMDALVKSVTAGKGAMPPGGLCTDCSTEDYQAVIEFMSK